MKTSARIAASLALVLIPAMMVSGFDFSLPKTVVGKNTGLVFQEACGLFGFKLGDVVNIDNAFARRALNLSDPVTVKEGETEYRRCEWKKPVSPVDSMTVTFDGDKKIDALDCAVKCGNPEAVKKFAEMLKSDIDEIYGTKADGYKIDIEPGTEKLSLKMGVRR